MTETASGSFDYGYDYAGRLLLATSKTAVAGYTQSFVYTRNGSMKNNTRTGSYGAPSEIGGKSARSQGSEK